LKKGSLSGVRRVKKDSLSEARRVEKSPDLRFGLKRYCYEVRRVDKFII
jgi:hypothetical protein